MSLMSGSKNADATNAQPVSGRRPLWFRFRLWDVNGMLPVIAALSVTVLAAGYSEAKFQARLADMMAQKADQESIMQLANCPIAAQPKPMSRVR